MWICKKNLIKFLIKIKNSKDDEEGSAFRSISVCEKEGFIVGAKSNGLCYVFDYGYDRDLELVSTFEAHKTYITKCLLSPENS